MLTPYMHTFIQQFRIDCCMNICICIFRIAMQHTSNKYNTYTNNVTYTTKTKQLMLKVTVINIIPSLLLVFLPGTDNTQVLNTYYMPKKY